MTDDTVRRRRSTPTSSEVAERAGVSRTTVSFVLNDVRSMNISETTRQKVLQAASELGYEPNAAARSLAGGSTGTMAVLIPRSDHLHVDSFLPRLLSAVNDRCHRYGYKVLLEAADDLGKAPGAFVNLARSKRVDGLVIANMRTAERPFVQQLSEQGFPVVVVGNGLEPFYGRASAADDTVTAHRLTRHLIDSGHRRIAHLAYASEDYENVVQRHAGYLRALQDAGIAPDPALVTHADISAHSGYVAMQRLMARRVEFTALFAGNDTVAFGAMRALVEAGRRIPDDVAVVGYDDIPLAPFACPPLTTMRVDPLTQGQEAVEFLRAQLGGEPYQRSEAAYGTEFILRESCGALRRG
jgi:LacI family transcriptional regulator